MSGTAPGARRAVTLEALHAIRAGKGLEALRLTASGRGFVFGALGAFRVRGSLDTVVLCHAPRDRLRVFFVGLHGLSWATLRLPPVVASSPPVVRELSAPVLPALAPLPELAVRLTVRPPEPP
jgi:hypothetical protein